MAEGIYKRGDSWAIVINLGIDPETGKRKQKWYSFKGTKKEAEKERTKLLRQRDTGELIADPTKLTLAEYLQYWLRTTVALNAPPKTQAEYRFRMDRYIIPLLGKIRLTKLTVPHLREAYARLSTTGLYKKPLAASSLAVVHSTLNAALRQAVHDQMIGHNVADVIKLQKSPRPEMTVWTVDHALVFLAALGNDHSAYGDCMALALFTGMREGELLGLRWVDVDLERARVQVVQQLQQIRKMGKVIGNTKTASGNRSIALSPLALDLVRKHRVRQNEEKLRAGGDYEDNGLVFANPLGRSLEPAYLRIYFARIVKAAGVPSITFHGLRHTHATLLLAENVHPKIVSERLGHASVATTLNIYSHVLPGLQGSAAAHFDKLLRPKTETASVSGG